jgi:hypothetical protein
LYPAVVEVAESGLQMEVVLVAELVDYYMDLLLLILIMLTQLWSAVVDLEDQEITQPVDQELRQAHWE